MKPIIHNSWQTILQEEFDKDYYQELRSFLIHEYHNQTVYPEMHHIYTAFEWTPFEKVKVVIIGQDPYHGKNQAHGLSFSVQPNISVPPSLRNVYKELENDLGYAPVSHGYLKRWADQGVLMLNSILTVRDGKPMSHQGKGWEQLTDCVIEKLNSHKNPIVFILWGKLAQEKGKKIDLSKHFIVKSVHPSPLSAYRGFFGSKPFSTTNAILEQHNVSKIEWQLPMTV